MGRGGGWGRTGSVAGDRQAVPLSLLLRLLLFRQLVVARRRQPGMHGFLPRVPSTTALHGHASYSWNLHLLLLARSAAACPPSMPSADAPTGVARQQRRDGEPCRLHFCSHGRLPAAAIGRRELFRVGCVCVGGGGGGVRLWDPRNKLQPLELHEPAP